MFDFIIGAGQGGSRIAKTFSKDFGVPACYMNLTAVDFSKFKVHFKSILIIEVGGTGRNVEYGERKVREKQEVLDNFLDNQKGYAEAEYVLVCIGGGGGSGTGFMYPLLDMLQTDHKKVLLLYTMPEKSEGIPAKPNALFGLNRLIRDYIHHIAILPIDNDYCVMRYGNTRTYDYWDKVNKGIVKSLYRFWTMTHLEQYKNYIDFTSGYKALDLHDVQKVVFTVGGFLDIREVSFDNIVVGDLGKDLKKASLTFGDLDLKTTRRYAVSMGIPDTWKGHSAGIRSVLQFIANVFNKVELATGNTPDITRSSYFNKKIVRGKLHILATGITTESKGLRKMLQSAEKDMEVIRKAKGIQELDLKKLIF